MVKSGAGDRRHHGYRRRGSFQVDELGLVVQARIEALIQSGLLESRGNVQNWRHSEVRRV